jgi:hypothetical protein
MQDQHICAQDNSEATRAEAEAEVNRLQKDIEHNKSNQKSLKDMLPEATDGNGVFGITELFEKRNT